MPPVFQPCTSLGLIIICRLDENGGHIGYNGFPDIRYNTYQEALNEEIIDNISYFGLSSPNYKFRVDFTLPHNLTSLSLVNCKIKSLSHVIFPKKLIRLDVKGNHLKKIPDNLPEGLLHLDVSYNNIIQLRNIPPNLQSINCKNNRIEKIPKVFPDSLRYIKLQNNRISILPKNIHNGLKLLEIQNNSITEIPKSIAECHEIEVQWEGNAVEVLPVEINNEILVDTNKTNYKNFIINKNV